MSLKHDLDEKMMGLALDKVDVIFITDKYLMERMRKLKLPKDCKPIQVMYVEKLTDLKALSIVDMRKNGWERVERLEKLAEKQKAKEAKNGETS